MSKPMSLLASPLVPRGQWPISSVLVLAVLHSPQEIGSHCRAQHPQQTCSHLGAFAGTSLKQSAQGVMVLLLPPLTGALKGEWLPHLPLPPLKHFVSASTHSLLTLHDGSYGTGNLSWPGKCPGSVWSHTFSVDSFPKGDGQSHCG